MTDSSGLPPGWEDKLSVSKNLPYYFNPGTKESRWDPPEGSDIAQLKDYMAKKYPSSGKDRPAVANGSNKKIRVAHLLIKHQGSRNPTSWRESKITRSEDQARAILEKHKANIEQSKKDNNEYFTLGKIAIDESDCSSARKGGDLGLFGRGEMQKEFEEAAFALKEVGDVSGIVETASGLHLIEKLSINKDTNGTDTSSSHPR